MKNWEIENFLEIRDNKLYINEVSSIELTEKYGTPLFVFSESRIKHNIERIKRAENSIGCTLKICYAAKANSNMAILRAVKDAGSDIEVNSGGELWKVLKIGFAPEQIIFNGTSKEVWEIENAINAGIYAIQVDSLLELELIEATANHLEKRANVSLRLVPEIETNTHSGLQTALLTSKFGMMPDEALSAFHQYKDSKFLDMCGIHLHIGSQNPHSAPYAEALKTLFEMLRQIRVETGIKLKHINLGGGFPVNYLRDDSQTENFNDEQREMFSANLEPSEVLKESWKAIEEITETETDANFLKNIELLLEPGRSIIADAGVCLTTVRNLKTRPILEKSVVSSQKSEVQEKNNSLSTQHSALSTDNWLLTDAGFNILLSMETYKWFYQTVHAGRADETHSFSYKLAGPLCDGGDVYFDIESAGRLPDYRNLPPNIKAGEILALLNCGAYSVAQMFQYNGRFLPAIVLIKENGDVELIRKRDTFEDLINNDIF